MLVERPATAVLGIAATIGAVAPGAQVTPAQDRAGPAELFHDREVIQGHITAGLVPIP